LRPFKGERCKRCDRHRDDAGGLSRAGYCIDCSAAAVADNARQLAEHRGPYFLHWRRSVAGSVGAQLDAGERRPLTAGEDQP
jgi:hypothetical protein